jgi:hypothetical protein
MKRFLTVILVLSATFGYGMAFTGYNTYKLDTPPGTGVNPPTGYIFTWETVTAGVITHQFRDSAGTDNAFAFIDYTNPANIVQSASYRFVTDTEKSTWNGKQDALGFTPVPNTRTVNAKQLNDNITLTQDDIGDGTTNKAYTATEKSKLSGIEAGANNYVHPATDGSLHVPATSTTSDGKLLQAGATAGSFSWVVGASSMVGLGNVTNESKATMFTSPVFTGTVTAGLIKPASDSTTAIKIQNAAGSADVITIDTTNGHLAINTTSIGQTLNLPLTGNIGFTNKYVWSMSNSGVCFDGGTHYPSSYRFAVSSSGGLYITSAGSHGVNIVSPTAYLHIKAGTATAGTAPLKLTSGTNLTTPEAGAVEFDGTYLYYTDSTPTRRTLALYNYAANNFNGTGTFTTTGTVTTGDVKLNTAGNGLYIKEGSNATLGVATLATGTATVSTTKVTANSRIFLTVQSLGTVTAPKAIAVTARTATTSFVITSEDATDTSVVAWQIIEPL